MGLLIVTLIFPLVVAVVSANPFMPSGSWSNEPAPPSISVQSPSETQAYSSGQDVWLNFTVAVPITDWYSSKSGYLYPEPYATTLGTLIGVKFSLDGKPARAASSVSTSPLRVSKVYNPQSGLFHFSINLGNLPTGKHTVVISAEGSGYYGNLTHSAFSDSFILDVQESDKTKVVSSSTSINFEVSGDPPIIQTLPFITASVAIAAVTGAGLLFYSRKLKHKTVNIPANV
ncbi:MAG: hypothetical protein NWE98_09540 [Candidatus Bathyarchaeota archaeon]|nr:hypothetical protein [Candidatus Bathyarchaeota archaeon]